MADCKHQIDLCPDCDGLQTVRLDRLPASRTSPCTAWTVCPILRYPSSVYVGQVPARAPIRRR
ncbi:hypothetical protein ACFPN0_32170 [Kitasatospora cinereorecta]